MKRSIALVIALSLTSASAFAMRTVYQNDSIRASVNVWRLKNNIIKNTTNPFIRHMLHRFKSLQDKRVQSSNTRWSRQQRLDHLKKEMFLLRAIHRLDRTFLDRTQLQVPAFKLNLKKTGQPRSKLPRLKIRKATSPVGLRSYLDYSLSRDRTGALVVRPKPLRAQ